jgi:hypothetical protein
MKELLQQSHVSGNSRPEPGSPITQLSPAACVPPTVPSSEQTVSFWQQGSFGDDEKASLPLLLPVSLKIFFSF